MRSPIRWAVAAAACLSLAVSAPSFATAGEAEPGKPKMAARETSTAAAMRSLVRTAHHNPHRAPALSKAAADQALNEARGWAHRRAAGAPSAKRSAGAMDDAGVDARGRDATLVLRDLRRGLPRLADADRADARRILARPTDSAADPDFQGYSVPERYTCNDTICVHWVDTSRDAVPQTDANGDGIPDWASTTLGVLQQVWAHEIDASGYRTPLVDSDSENHGPDGRLDVYLGDLGGSSAGLYGYCTSDDPAQQWTQSAFCVLDNDYVSAQYDGQAPLASLEVTAAHEFFHAVQFAYDWSEDDWLMEGTATWMEDEVFDQVNDNYQYLATSTLTHPEYPVDYGDEGYQYGAWVFWRFLAEYYGTDTAPDPAVIRYEWELADASPGGPDMYSLQAVVALAHAAGDSFSRVFADYGAINRTAHRWYFEGRAYPQAPLRKTYKLTAAARGTGTWTTKLDHLANTNVAYVAGSTLTGAWRLRITLNLPTRSRGSAATIAIEKRSGAIQWVDVKLNQYGDATVYVPFTRSTVSRVALTLTNASTQEDCGYQTVFSCGGLTDDDELAFAYAAKAVR